MKENLYNAAKKYVEVIERIKIMRIEYGQKHDILNGCD